MATVVASLPLRSRRNSLPIYLKEAKYEFLKMIRMPAYALPAILFPVMFYVLFGIIFGSRQGGGNGAARYLLATYSAFGVIGASLFGFGAGVAIERGQGWMQVKRASPMPPLAYFFGKMANSVSFGVVIGVLLLAIGTLFGGVKVSVTEAASLIAAIVLGCIPFCAIGLVIGYTAGPNSAPAIVNLVYLPASFCSGLWIPVEMLPKLIQNIAYALPPYHLGQLALAAVHANRNPHILANIAGLLVSTVCAVALARYAYQHDTGKLYG